MKESHGVQESNGLDLEIATLRLVNAVSYTSGTRAHSRRFQDATGLELPPTDLRLIELLAGREPVPTSVVARELGIDLAQASRQATQLERAGIVARTTDPADRRRTLVALTDYARGLMDTWLLTWAEDYLAAVGDWDHERISNVADWFALVHTRFEQALPDNPHPETGALWADLAGDQYDADTAHFLRSIIGIVTWVGLSGGIDELLTAVGSPVRQNGFYTLQVVAQSGPLSIAEAAERLAVDPSQASKRLSQLAALKLVDKAIDGFDRRSSLIRISRRGRALLDKVAEVQLAYFETLTDDISAEDRERWTPLAVEYVEALMTGQRRAHNGADASAGLERTELFSPG